MKIGNDSEFDGTTVLCRVCGDKASGFHYGVHSCEGCKGFFRRSIQQKIQYRPCTKNQQCSILRINRNRCQYCRLKKCIAVGMSRDAVRFGRVPKREKAKILAAMQSMNAKFQEKALATELDDLPRLVATVIQAHEDTCTFTKDKAAIFIERSRQNPVYSSSGQLFCPVNPFARGAPDGAEEFNARFTPAITGVVEFGKKLPGFNLLGQDDQITLLKSSVFEVLLLRLVCMFDFEQGSFITFDGTILRKDRAQSNHARFLLDSMFDFAERLNNLRLSDSELGLFCAVVVISADRPGLRNTDLVNKMQGKLMQALQATVSQTHTENPHVYQELLKVIPDLRTLNTLHSEKLYGVRVDRETAGQQGSEFPLSAMAWIGYPNIEQEGPRQDWLTGGEKSPSPSSVGSVDTESSGEVEQINYINNKRQRLTEYEEVCLNRIISSSPGKCPYNADSPGDSGIEMGKDSGSSGSACSSPRSEEEEKVKEDDMPVLKRALQAPPLINTNLLMDEAYKPHKKFRALRKDSSDCDTRSDVASPPSPLITTPPPASLVSQHSLLMRTLSQGPKMTEQQLKRTEVIHNMIMKTDTSECSTYLNTNSALYTAFTSKTSNSGNYIPHQNNSSINTQSTGHANHWPFVSAVPNSNPSLSNSTNHHPSAMVSGPMRAPPQQRFVPSPVMTGNCGQYYQSVASSPTRCPASPPQRLPHNNTSPSVINPHPGYTSQPQSEQITNPPKQAMYYNQTSQCTNSSPSATAKQNNMVEIVIDITDNQPLNLSKKLDARDRHKVEGVH